DLHRYVRRPWEQHPPDWHALHRVPQRLLLRLPQRRIHPRHGRRDGPGYNGLSVQAERPYASAVNLMLAAWHSGGGTFHGLTPNGENAANGDPELERMIEAVQAEFDIDEQIAKTHEI